MSLPFFQDQPKASVFDFRRFGRPRSGNGGLCATELHRLRSTRCGPDRYPLYGVARGPLFSPEIHNYGHFKAEGDGGGEQAADVDLLVEGEEADADVDLLLEGEKDGEEEEAVA